jgi:hypothetical protein
VPRERTICSTASVDSPAREPSLAVRNSFISAVIALLIRGKAELPFSGLG